MELITNLLLLTGTPLDTRLLRISALLVFPNYMVVFINIPAKTVISPTMGELLDSSRYVMLSTWKLLRKATQTAHL